MLPMAKERNLNVEVLRCVLMFGVVLQHVIYLTPLGRDSLDITSVAILVALTFPAVDGFTAVSGFFGVRCSVAKLANLVGLVLFSGCLSFAISWIFEPCAFGFSWFRYWYVGAYAKLLLASLLINPFLRWLDTQKRIFKVIVLAIIVIASYLSLIWFPWVSHSPRTVIFVYLVTRLLVMILGRDAIKTVFARIFSWIALGFSVFLIVTLGYLGGGEVIHNYANPITVLTGILLVFSIQAFPVSNEGCFKRLCAKISPSMIVVYMLHASLLKTFFASLPMLIFRKIPFLGLGGTCFVVALIAFVICCLVDSIRRCVMSYIRNSL